MQAQTIFFIGKPGSGKGTQAELLSKATGWPVVVASAELRALAGADTFVGRKLRVAMDTGILTPHWVATYVYLRELFALPSEEGVIFDGFGRRPSEVEPVIESLQWLERSFKMIHLNISDTEVKQRIALRKEEEERADDDVIEKRLQVYRSETEPAIEMFREKGALIEVNGEGSIEDIAAEIRKELSI